MVDLNIKLTLPEPVNNVLNPVAKQAGTTLESIWDYVFGGANNYFAKVNLKRKLNFEQYKKSLENKISQIPLDKITDPKLSVIGPALEASKYYIEEEDLRNLFTSLVASSMNADKTSIAHHSFVEIIKQLSSLDAENLMFVASKKKYAICQVKVITPFSDSKENYSAIISHLFIKSQGDSVRRNSSSLCNLERLGLCSLDYTHQLSDDSLYDAIFRNFQLTSEYVPVKGIVSLTSLGIDFVKVCL